MPMTTIPPRSRCPTSRCPPRRSPQDAESRTRSPPVALPGRARRPRRGAIPGAAARRAVARRGGLPRMLTVAELDPPPVALRRRARRPGRGAIPGAAARRAVARRGGLPRMLSSRTRSPARRTPRRARRPGRGAIPGAAARRAVARRGGLPRMLSSRTRSPARRTRRRARRPGGGAIPGAAARRTRRRRRRTVRTRTGRALRAGRRESYRHRRNRRAYTQRNRQRTHPPYTTGITGQRRFKRRRATAVLNHPHPALGPAPVLLDGLRRISDAAHRGTPFVRPLRNPLAPRARVTLCNRDNRGSFFEHLFRIRTVNTLKESTRRTCPGMTGLTGVEQVANAKIPHRELRGIAIPAAVRGAGLRWSRQLPPSKEKACVSSRSRHH